MAMITEHVLLAAGTSYESCCQQVRNYFARTTLVRYDSIAILETQSLPANHPDFFAKLESSFQKNTDGVISLIQDLHGLGITQLDDLLKLQQGYGSKTLHILSHFLDGFIGIDSYFYNLTDDSHWVNETTLSAIQAIPSGYWLIHIQGTTESVETASLLHTSSRPSL